VTTFIERFADPGPRPDGGPRLRVAVKDLIDMVGLPTTAGSRAVADRAEPAGADAVCLADIRRAESEGQVAMVGKVGLHELAFGVSGVNPWFGTPVNPLDADRVPGGSSSGSAVAVATGEADVALGSDTGGSVRIPAACCGVAGLKTTWGRISTVGVWPLAPSLDTIGPLARDVAGLVAGMDLLEPGFAATVGPPGSPLPGAGIPPTGARRVARLRLPAAEQVDAAIDAALRAAGLDVVQVDLPGWAEADRAATDLLLAEAWATVGHLVDAGLGDDVAARLRAGARVSGNQLAEARRTRDRWRGELTGIIDTVGPLVLPTLADDPPTLEDAARTGTIRYTLPVNLAGFPALTIPVPAAGAGRLPVGLQLVGPAAGEAGLLAVGAVIEAAGRA
jgi:amidase